MPRKDELAPKTLYIEEVPGVSVGWDWSGRDGSGNRRRIPPNYFITADNVRLESGEVQGRKGLAKVNSGDSSDTSCVIGATTLPTVPNAGRYFITVGFESGNVKLFLYDPKYDDSQIIDIDPDGQADANEFLIKYKGNIYGDGGKLTALKESGGTLKATQGNQVIFPEPKCSQNGIGFVSGAGSQAVVAPTLDTDRPGESDLYFVSESGTDTNELPYRWDGNQSYPIATPTDIGSNSVQHIGYLAEKIFVVVSPAVEGNPCIYERGFDGTWTAFNCPTLTQEDQFTCMGITYYKDKALLHGWAEGSGGGGTAYGTILVWDGSSLTLGTQTSQTGNSESYNTGIFDAAIYSGNYRYGWTDFSGGTPYLGSYNGSTFSDTATDLSTPFASGYGPVGLGVAGNTFVLTAYEHGNDFNTKAYVTQDLSTFTELTIENGGDIAIGPPHKVFIL